MPEVTEEELVPRRAARVLLLDAEGRVLLIHGIDPGRPEHAYWFTVGGGVDPGESDRAAAVRELFEETGLRIGVDDLAGPVHHEVAHFPFDNRWYRQEQDFFAVRVATWEPVRSFMEEIEQRYVLGTRWWTADELEQTAEAFYPQDLAGLVRAAAVVC